MNKKRIKRIARDSKTKIRVERMKKRRKNCRPKDYENIEHEKKKIKL